MVRILCLYLGYMLTTSCKCGTWLMTCLTCLYVWARCCTRYLVPDVSYRRGRTIGVCPVSYRYSLSYAFVLVYVRLTVRLARLSRLMVRRLMGVGVLFFRGSFLPLGLVRWHLWCVIDRSWHRPMCSWRRSCVHLCWYAPYNAYDLLICPL